MMNFSFDNDDDTPLVNPFPEQQQRQSNDDGDLPGYAQLC
jgi:hypothetical protein